MESTFNHVSVARQYKLSGMQKFVAERLTASRHETASVTATAEVPMRGLLEAQDAWRARGIETSLTHHMIHLTAHCLDRHRLLNSTLHEGVVYEYSPINVALAISMPNGDLQAVVIRDASGKSVADIATETDALIGLARDGKLELEHVRGGTFTLSNYGSLRHTVWATPIIPPDAHSRKLCQKGKPCHQPTMTRPGSTKMIEAMQPAADATVCTMLFSKMLLVRTSRRIAMEITAAGIDVAKVRPTLSPR